MSKAVNGMTSVLVFDANDTQLETEKKWEKWWKDNKWTGQGLPMGGETELLDE